MMTLPPKEKAALERLIFIARRDTGQSRIVANFLLAWWNASECGGFDPTDLWGVDHAILLDMLTMLAYLATYRRYPDTLGYGKQFASLVQLWRPALLYK